MAPVMKKTRMIAPLVAPMVRRMAMSRPLSFTSMIRPEMMFSAATSTISVEDQEHDVPLHLAAR